MEKKTNNKKIYIVVAVIIVIVIMCGIVGKIVYDKNKEEQDRLQLASDEYINKLKVASAYLQENKYNCYEFNSILSNVMGVKTNKTNLLIEKYNEIGTNGESVCKPFFELLTNNNNILEDKMKELNNAPTEQLQESYSLLEESYNKYYEIYQLALNPKKIYITYTNELSKISEEFEENYKKFKDSIVDFNIDTEVNEVKLENSRNGISFARGWIEGILNNM